MKIKHWQGYGSVTATKVKDNTCKLHIRVVGNHEWGIYRNDLYDLYNWLVKKFDKSIKDSTEWHRLYPTVEISQGYDYVNEIDVCDYYFNYK
jgi:hypothetical protein